MSSRIKTKRHNFSRDWIEDNENKIANVRFLYELCLKLGRAIEAEGTDVVSIRNHWWDVKRVLNKSKDIGDEN